MAAFLEYGLHGITIPKPTGSPIDDVSEAIIIEELHGSTRPLLSCTVSTLVCVP